MPIDSDFLVLTKMNSDIFSQPTRRQAPSGMTYKLSDSIPRLEGLFHDLPQRERETAYSLTQSLT